MALIDFARPILEEFDYDPSTLRIDEVEIDGDTAHVKLSCMSKGCPPSIYSTARIGPPPPENQPTP